MAAEPRIPLASPWTGADELDEVRAVLASGYLSQGPKVVEFEQLVADRVGTRHAVATSSCTTAMHLALVALGIGPGDEVLVPDFTFPATANVVVQQGAVPVLVDVQPDTYNVEPAQLARHLTDRTRAVMPVHLFGLSADLDPCLEFARDHGLAVIEDAACALGATYRGRPCGPLGDVGCYSFHPRKVITTGEGGMVVTDDDALAERLRLFRSHGGVRAGGRFTFEEAGFNYRLSDVHAALGVAQMRRLPEILARRRALAARLTAQLAEVPGITPPAEPAWAGHVYQAYVATVDEGVDRDAMVAALASRGIETTIGTYGLHAQPFFHRAYGYKPGDLPVSWALARRTLALPLYPQMTDADVDRVAESVQAVLAGGLLGPDMCGIAGFVQAHADLPLDTVDLQLRLLRHRGPGLVGRVRASGRGVVGQTRLAVIDLLTGDPPISNEDGSVGVALNGEIYNFAALRHELAAAGHQLKTQGDTEVIAHLAEDLEPGALAARLEGMFAFAVWDTARQRLVLGRDRVGKKPLYWWWGDGTLVFASEIKAVLAHPRVPRRLDAGVIPTYLAMGYAPTPTTFFEGIRSVPPGCVLVLEQGGTPEVRRYWELPPTPAQPLYGSMAATAAAVRATLTAAVDRRLVADVPLGAFLSGGVDSSAVVGIMAGLTDRPVRTFTIGFEDDEGFDERPYARLVADRFRTEHTEFVVRPDAVDLVERLVDHHDQPFGDSSAVPTYLLSELTRRHVTVALCGDGGDEVFAGYERFAAALALGRYDRLPAPARRPLAAAADRLPRTLFGGRVGSVRRFLALSGLDLPQALLAMIAYVPRDARVELVGPADADDALGPYLEAWRRSEGAGPLDRLCRLNLDTYLVDDLLPKVDRMSMAHGLEVRAPLLDREVVELGMRLPPAMRARGMSLKRVLKAAVADLLPPEILGRRKRGFGVPLDRWFRTDLRAYAEGMLCTPGARVRHHLRPAGVDALVARHMGGTTDAGNALWTLLTLEIFLRREGW